MQINLLAFGQAAAITGANIQLDVSVPDTDSLRKLLLAQYPELANIKYALAVDKKVANENIPLTAGAVVALLPPFSGG